jgi:hypothetical protein
VNIAAIHAPNSAAASVAGRPAALGAGCRSVEHEHGLQAVEAEPFEDIGGE